MAQSVERILGKDEVISSILISSSIRRRHTYVCFFSFYSTDCFSGGLRFEISFRRNE